MKEFFAVLQRCPLFSGLETGQMEELLSRLSPVRRRWARGETVLHPGEPAPGIGVVLSGGVRIVREDFWGNRSLLAAVEPGDLFAEAFACAGAPLTVRVEAAQAGEAAFFSPGGLMDPALGGGAVSGRLLEIMARKNLMLNRKIDHLSQRTTRAKVLSYLSHQAERAGSSSFAIPLDRQELADYLSVDRSALSAQLGQLRREGVLDFSRSRFTLLQKPE